MKKEKILQEVFERLKSEGLAISLSSLGEMKLTEIDSLQLATLMLELESKYHVSFSIEFLDSLNQKTINDLISLLSEEEKN